MILLIIFLSRLFSIMADESKIPIKQCSNCKVKLSSDRAEPHSLCGDCRFHENGHVCTYTTRCSECQPLDEVGWKKFSALKKKL